MSRTLIETYFNVHYIGNKDPETRAKRYVDYHTRVRQEWQKIIMQFYPNKPLADTQLDPETLERAKAFKKSKWVEGDAGQVEIMALEEDPLDLDANGQPEKADFDLVIYFWTSHFVHVRQSCKAH